MQQHELALMRANEVRLRGAEIKRQLKSGRLSIREALDDPAVQKWSTVELVAYALGHQSWRGSRPTHAARVLARRRLAPIGVYETTLVRALSAKRRDEVAAAVLSGHHLCAA